MILFKDIINTAFNLFDDPDISEKYYSDPVGFQQEMLEFLLIGKNKFLYPTAITDQLNYIDKPQGQIEIIDGNGSNIYALESTPHTEAVFSYRINDELVFGSYDRDNNSVTFPRNVEAGEICSVAWFYAGAFTSTFENCFRSDLPINAIMEKIKTILAYALCSAWADKEVGRAIEVRNILTDHDFKMYSPANSADAKVRWRNQMNKDMDTLVSELNWRIFSEPKGGTRFGK